MSLEMLLDQLDYVIQTPEDVEKLEQTILQLAVQGKLVPQDPNDEPATILQERNVAERKRLERNREIPSLGNLRPIESDEMPYDLPQNWTWCRLGEVTSYGISGKVGPQDVEIGTWVLELKDIEKTTSRLLQKERFGEYTFKSTKSVFSTGDVLYGKLRPYLDKVIVADEDGVCTTEIMPLHGYVDIDPHYLRLCLKRPDFIEYANQNTYGMNLPRLKTQDARMALLPLAPLEEQKRIVAKVDELFAQTRQLKAQLAQTGESRTTLQKAAVRRLVSAETPTQRSEAWHLIAGHFDTLYDVPAHIDDLKQAILQLAVQGKLVPQDPRDEPASVLLERIAAKKKRLVKEGKARKERGISPITGEELPFGLPDGWEWAKLGKLAQVVEYGTSRKADAGRKIGVPVLRMNNIEDGQVVLDQLKYVPPDIKDLPHLYLKHNDLLFNRTNSYELVGKSGVFKGADDTFTLASYLIRVTLFTDYVDPDYVNAYLNAPICRTTQIEPHITQQTNQANFNGTKLRNIVVPLPPYDEQMRIMAKVNELLALCDRLTEQVSAAYTTRERLLEALLRGAT